ncbi:melibiase, partial [Haematococcus lacustris]
MGKVSVCLLLTSISVLLVFANVSHGLDNGVGLVPAMGWNSWNYFRCQINETLIREVADAMVSSGLRDAGYKYVNLDDCWMQKRDGDGRIVPFADKFPSGMK